MSLPSNQELSSRSYRRLTTRALKALAMVGVLACAAEVGSAQTTIVRGNQIQLFNSTGTFSTSLTVPSGQASTYSLTLPGSAPSQGALLYLSNGTGQTAWTAAPSTGQILVAQGAGLTPTWVDVSTVIPSTSWLTTGNANTTGTSFLGTTGTQPLIIKTSNNEALRIDPDGKVGIGTGSTIGEKLTLSNGNLLLANSGTRSELHFQEANAGGSDYVGISAPSSISTSYTVALPAAAPTAGQMLRAGATTATDLEWSEMFIPRFIRKTADQAVGAILAVQLDPYIVDDTHLKADVVANATYIFDMYLKVRKSAIVAVADLAIGFTGPNGSTISFGYNSAGADIPVSVLNALNVTTGAISVTALGASSTFVSVKGIFTTGDNAGTLQFRFGQSGVVVLGVTTTLQQNSYMMITRVE